MEANLIFMKIQKVSGQSKKLDKKLKNCEQELKILKKIVNKENCESSLFCVKVHKFH